MMGETLRSLAARRGERRAAQEALEAARGAKVASARMTRELRANPLGGTYTRPRGTQYSVENVRCIADSEFDSLGFAVQRPSDPDGDRCWSPVVGRACEVCGKEV